MTCIKPPTNQTMNRPRSKLLAPMSAVWRSALVLLVAIGSLSMAACDKPKEADCQKAIANIRQLYGTAGADFGVSPEAMVRSCRGSASPESVQCFIKAKSVEELQRCEGGTFEEMFGSENDKQNDKQGDEASDSTDQAGQDQAGQDQAGQ